MVKTIVEDRGLSSAFERHDDILVEMGRAIAVWGAVSHLLRTLVERILHCSPRQAEVLLQSFPGEDRRLRFVIDLIESQDSSGEAEGFRTVLNALCALTSERNLIVHGAPVSGGKKDVRPRSEYFLNMRKDESAPNRYVNAREMLAEHTRKLKALGGELFDLLYGEPP